MALGRRWALALAGSIASYVEYNPVSAGLAANLRAWHWSSVPQERLKLLQGTLDQLILRTLIFGAQHGQGIARVIEQTSGDELLVEHGALYPALQRLEGRGWIAAKWGTSENSRRARFYTLTRTGRKQLVSETTKWRRLAGAIGRIIGPESKEDKEG